MLTAYGAVPSAVAVIVGAVANAVGNVTAWVTKLPEPLGPVNDTVPDWNVEVLEPTSVIASVIAVSTDEARLAKCVSNGAMLSVEVG